MTDPDTTEKPRQISAHAVQFLHALGRNAPFAFRALVDDKQRKAQAKLISGGFNDRMQELRRLNDQGYGIFVQINAADGKGVSAANITGATCFFVDFDGIPLESIDRFSLRPQIVVETSPGKRHYYWRVDDIPRDQFSAVQKRLIALFSSDRSVHDLPRVMRLPGFLHQKDEANPHLVTCTVIDGLCPYGFADFASALADAEQKHGIGIEPQSQRPARPAGPKDEGAGNLATAKAAIAYLLEQKALDLAEYQDWVRLGIAIKNSHGEEGFALFLELSAADKSFVSEDDVRSTWDGINTDRPESDQLTIATFVAQAKEAGWVPPGRRAKAGKGEGETNSKADPASLMLASADAAGDIVFISPDGKGYVNVQVAQSDGSTRHVTMSLDGSEYRGILALRYHEDQVIKTAPKEQISAATTLMQARAFQSGERIAVHLRAASHDGRIYVNLDPIKGKVAEIDATGWRILNEEPPVRFVVGSRGALPMPEAGGSIETFARHFNVAGDDLLRIIGFLLAAFCPGNANPMLLIEGVAGSAKSTMGDKCLALVDPPVGNHAAGRFSMATDERNLHVQASRCSVMYLDNISRFAPEIADQICRLLTGGALSSRKLYTVDEEHQSFIAMPCIVSCIGAPTARGDLLDRTLRVTAQTIEHRRTERAVWHAFNADAGKMVGFLFDCLATALSNREHVERLAEAQELKAPRLADFAVWVEAASSKLGLEVGDFSALLNAEQEVMQRSAVEGHPLVDSLTTFFAAGGAELQGKTARELLDLLVPHSRGRNLPACNQLKSVLQRLAEGLRTSGLIVTIGRDSKRKVTTFDISMLEPFLSQAKASATQSRPVEAPAPDDYEPLPF